MTIDGVWSDDDAVVNPATGQTPAQVASAGGAVVDCAVRAARQAFHLNDIDKLDLTNDGADEIDHAGRMIKGDDICLLWETMVARASRCVMAVVDDGKLVETLGRFPLPPQSLQHRTSTRRRSGSTSPTLTPCAPWPSR